MGLHQWKKFNIYYERIWDAKFAKDYDFEKDRWIMYTDSYRSPSDCVIYTGYRIVEDGKFELTNPKPAKNAMAGDVMYCFRREDVDTDTAHFCQNFYYGSLHDRIKYKIYKITIDDSGREEQMYSEESYYYIWSGSNYDTQFDKTYGYAYVKQTVAKQGQYVGVVQGQDNAYPQNGQKDGFWYVYDKNLNNPPIINISNADLGIIDKPPTVTFTVKDPDKGQTGLGSIYLDDKKIDSFSFAGSASRSIRINDNDWLRLLNGKHTIKISAEDSEGESSYKVIVFEKSITKIGFELENPLEADAMVTKATINLVGSIPKDAILKVEVCNNAHDPNPTWEDVTTKVIKERKIFFANKQKTADRWGVNVRVNVDRNGATGECYISSIGGSYE